MKLFVATLPPKSDPDQILQNHGAGKLQECVSKSVPWFRWIAARIIAPADKEKPDPHAAVREYLQIIKDIEVETELQEALELAAELSDLKLSAIKRQLKKERGEDGRATTSAANGAQGGRPRNPYADMADEFVTNYTRDGIFSIRYFRGSWRRYRKGQWIEVSDDDIDGVLMTWIRRNYRDLSESRTQHNVIKNLKATEIGHVLDDTEIPCWLDEKNTPAPGWMPVKNKIVHIPTVLECFDGDEIIECDGMTMDSTPRLFTPHALPYPFEPEAQCPKWLDYLKDVQPDANDRDLLRKMCGLMLVPETRFNVFFILQGESGTGKSVFLYVLDRLLGKQNTCTVPLTKFEDEHYTHQLTENLMNTIDDMREVNLKDVEGVIKIATDGGFLDVRRQYKEGTRAQVIARTVAATNQLPRFYEKSDAIWERLRIINFPVKIRGTAKQNKNLRFEIIDELPGIFIWALRGLADLQEMNLFPEHSTGEPLKEKHKAACDPVGSFLAEHFERNDQCRLESSFIYKHYTTWANDGGYRPANQGTVNREVERIFSVEKRPMKFDGKTLQGFSGMAVKPGAFYNPPQDEELI